MDDDFTFGASVWDSSIQPVDLTLPKHDEPTTSSSPNLNDDFDDFGPAFAAADTADDDFGDFGEFGDTDDQAASIEFNNDFNDEDTYDTPVMEGSSTAVSWQPLRLDPLPSEEELVQQLDALLAPLWERGDITQVTTSEGIRDIEGISQILAARQSRDLYNLLMKPPPPTKPPNWIRSRIRRQHLITLGIPVNLDEVLEPTAEGKRPLPPLQITTRPMSAPPGPRKVPQQNGHPAGSANNSRSGTPRPGGRSNQLGPKPIIDESRISRILESDPDNLPILPIPALEKHLAELRELTASASELLTYLLQSRDTLQQDSETYNGLIAELVGEAQKIKTSKGRTPIRKGTVS